MFELESKQPDEVVLTVKDRVLRFDLAKGEIDADLPVGKIQGPGEFEIAVGKIQGPGEFEIGEAAIRGIATPSGRTVYAVKVGNVQLGLIGDVEEAITLDELGVADILCTSSVRAVREIGPKVAVALGNVDGMVTELKLSARTEKKLKVKNVDALPAALEVVVLN